MNEVVSADEALDALRKVEQGVMETEAALEVIAAVIVANLDRWKAVKNCQNAGQIASLLTASLYPQDVLSCGKLRGLAGGWLPDFSQAEPHDHSIFRGCACFAIDIKYSRADKAPKRACEAVLEMIEKKGYLPDEVWE